MKQYFIIGGNGKEYGPVSESEVFEWIRRASQWRYSDQGNGSRRMEPNCNLEQFNFSTLPPITLKTYPHSLTLQKLRNKIHLTNPITIRLNK